MIILGDSPCKLQLQISLYGRPSRSARGMSSGHRDRVAQCHKHPRGMPQPSRWCLQRQWLRKWKKGTQIKGSTVERVQGWNRCMGWRWWVSQTGSELLLPLLLPGTQWTMLGMYVWPTLLQMLRRSRCNGGPTFKVVLECNRVKISGTRAGIFPMDGGGRGVHPCNLGYLETILGHPTRR